MVHLRFGYGDIYTDNHTICARTSLNPGNCWNRSVSMASVLASGRFCTNRILLGAARPSGPVVAPRL